MENQTTQPTAAPAETPTTIKLFKGEVRNRNVFEKHASVLVRVYEMFDGTEMVRVKPRLVSVAIGKDHPKYAETTVVGNRLLFPAAGVTESHTTTNRKTGEVEQVYQFIGLQKNLIEHINPQKLVDFEKIEAAVGDDTPKSDKQKAAAAQVGMNLAQKLTGLLKAIV